MSKIHREALISFELISASLGELADYVDVAEIKETVKLTKYAVQTRYPGEYDEITKEDYEESVRVAKDCLEWIKEKITEIEKGDGKP